MLSRFSLPASGKPLARFSSGTKLSTTRAWSSTEYPAFELTAPELTAATLANEPSVTTAPLMFSGTVELWEMLLEAVLADAAEELAHLAAARSASGTLSRAVAVR